MLKVLFDLTGSHGQMLGFALPTPNDAQALEALVAALHEEERKPLQRFAVRRKLTYAGGRYAMRELLRRLSLADGPILSDDRGAPVLPASVRGSISHKDEVACALVTNDTSAYYGVDVEGLPGPSDDLASHILTARELAQVSAMADAQRALELSLRFSAKEAIYKALDPYVRRYVAHEEVEVTPKPDGSAEVWSKVFPTGLRVEVTWRKYSDFVLTTCRIGT
ncbi:MAG: 4'-phosphopantetheinyl transferase [Myxococcota bacterium]|nr:4'-phosphopantetheinyl transferase superfamily protein [Myxococcota bacterium]